MMDPTAPTFAPARILVTGSTTWTDRAMIESTLSDYADRRRATGGSFRIITGMADGADEIARKWADTNEQHLLAEPLEAGDYPGPMHNYNTRMLGWRPELVVAFKEDIDFEWASSLCIAGTEHMCRIAASAGIPVLLNGQTWLTCPLQPKSPETTTPVMHQGSWGATLITVHQGDITKLDVDVIVNAANSSLLGGGGVDAAIHRAGGPDLLDACRKVVARQGGCPTGEAVITSGGALPASHVVHTVGPVWTGDMPDHHDSLLSRCYAESMRLANEAGATTIAFPNISTGVYRFPLERAAMVALDAVRDWLDTNGHNFTEVTFACFSEENFTIYSEVAS